MSAPNSARGPSSRGENVQSTTEAPNRKKKYVQTIAFTNSHSTTPLNTTTSLDSQAIPPGALWVLQCDADCNYEFHSATHTVTLTNSVWLQAGQQEYVYPEVNDIKINVIGRTGSGNLMLFVIC